MAARHEIQNLVRSNAFYWRPRIPRSFRRAAGRHLSLSLRQSGSVAQHAAARPQTETGSRIDDEGPAQSALPHRSRADGEHLDNLEFAARRIGSDPILAVRADIEVG